MNHPDQAHDSEQARAAAVIADLVRMRGARCAVCARALCGHQALISRAMGLRDRPHCHACLARQLGRPPDELRDSVYEHLMHQDCHRQGWHWADQQEDLPPSTPPFLPACLWPAGATPRGKAPAEAPAPATAPASGTAEGAPEVRFDAGDMGCGDLVLELRQRLRAMASGQILELTARDPGAPADIPAWCGMTGHVLLRSTPPRYWIRRKDG